MSTENQPPRVVVTDIQMPFGSMVIFMVKWAFAAIPAVLILIAVGFLGSALLAGIAGGVSNVWNRTSAHYDEPAPYTIQTQQSGAAVAPTTNVPKYAQRCKGNPEIEKCIALEKKLAEETPEQRKARQDKLYAERQAAMRQVK
jgi:hypothetical protein